MVLVSNLAFGNALTDALKSASSSAGTAAVNAAEQPLIAAATKAVPGLSQAQAALGSGSLFGLAKGKMSAAQFSQIEKAIPGVDKLVADATKKGLPKQLKGFSDVSTFLGKAGMTPDQVNQLASSLEKTVAAVVPSGVSSAFSSAINAGRPAPADAQVKTDTQAPMRPADTIGTTK
jgi:hypothetical protein